MSHKTITITFMDTTEEVSGVITEDMTKSIKAMLACNQENIIFETITGTVIYVAMSKVLFLKIKKDIDIYKEN